MGVRGTSRRLDQARAKKWIRRISEAMVVETVFVCISFLFPRIADSLMMPPSCVILGSQVRKF